MKLSFSLEFKPRKICVDSRRLATKDIQLLEIIGSKAKVFILVESSFSSSYSKFQVFESCIFFSLFSICSSVYLRCTRTPQVSQSFLELSEIRELDRETG